jgi:hypothetical protein
MNLKINGLILLGGLILGAYGGYKLGARREPAADVSQPVQAKANSNAKVTKTTKPSGEVVEVVECGASAQAQLPPLKAIKPSYSVGIIGLKQLDAITAEIRLAQTPFLLGVIIPRSLPDSKLSLRMEF